MSETTGSNVVYMSPKNAASSSGSAMISNRGPTDYGGGSGGGEPPDRETMQKLADLEAGLSGLRSEIQPLQDFHRSLTGPRAALGLVVLLLGAGSAVYAMIDNKFDAQNSRLDQRFDSQNSRMDDFLVRIDDKFARIDGKFDRVLGRVSENSAAISSIETKLDRIGEEVSSLKASDSTLE